MLSLVRSIYMTQQKPALPARRWNKCEKMTRIFSLLSLLHPSFGLAFWCSLMCGQKIFDGKTFFILMKKREREREKKVMEMVHHKSNKDRAYARIHTRRTFRFPSPRTHTASWVCVYNNPSTLITLNAETLSP